MQASGHIKPQYQHSVSLFIKNTVVFYLFPENQRFWTVTIYSLACKLPVGQKCIFPMSQFEVINLNLLENL